MDAFFGAGPSMWAAPSMGVASFNTPAMPMPSAEIPPGFPRTGPTPITVPVAATPVMGMTTLATAPGVTPASLLAMVGLRRGQPQGPANDQEVEEFLYDALELLPGTADIDVRCEGGRVTISGSVHHKRLKRDVGELAWSIPIVTDVQNTLGIAGRRRSRANANREAEGQQGTGSRKQT